MGYCVNCFYQGDNGIDENGNGRVFCMVKKKWLAEGDTCENYTEYADLDKNVRAEYAMEIRRANVEKEKLISVINYSWIAMAITMFIAFCMFLFVVKFFDKYIF